MEKDRKIMEDLGLINIENMQISKPFLQKMIDVEKKGSRFDVIQVNKLINETVTFTIHGADRLDATLICLLKASYVIQSQRYVRNNITSFRRLNSSDIHINSEYKKLIEDTVDLYNRMTELKEESKNKKRTTASDYKHGIPIEDARYIFPLTATTVISITMSGDKFIALLTLANMYKNATMSRLYSALSYELTRLGAPKFIDQCNYTYLVDNLFADNIEELLKLNTSVRAEVEDVGIDNIVRSILTSTTSDPSEGMNKYNTADKKDNLIERVTGYNHTSVLEQFRFTSMMKCSLVTFQQLSRHRIAITQPLSPEVLTQLVEIKEHILPPSIAKSEFVEEYIDICKRYKALAKKCIQTHNISFATCLLQNGDIVPFNYTVNVRTDVEIMNKRLCRNAQWEIRELMKKRKDLMIHTRLGKIYEGLAVTDCSKSGCKEGNYSCIKQNNPKLVPMSEGIVSELKSEYSYLPTPEKVMEEYIKYKKEANN